MRLLCTFQQVIEDHRPFNSDVSIETFFKKCSISFTFTRDVDMDIREPYQYLCRYRLMSLSKRKINIEPVLDDERKVLALLKTPSKTPSKATPNTPSLVVRLSRVSITEKNWSVSKNNGTKLLLKRAILADKNEKDSPKKATPKSIPKKNEETPKSSRTLNRKNIEEVLSMELKENSDEDIPTLIIRQQVPSTPKRKTSISKSSVETPKKILNFEDDEMATPTPRSGRKKVPVSYMEEDVSPVKRTPKKSARKMDESDDDFQPTPQTPKTPKTPRSRTPAQTPKHSVTKRILTSQLTPSLRNRAHSIDNIDGKFVSISPQCFQFQCEWPNFFCFFSNLIF